LSSNELWSFLRWMSCHSMVIQLLRNEIFE
jgi:hypothetical protein